jgi:hypothetical protein
LTAHLLERQIARMRQFLQRRVPPRQSRNLAGPCGKLDRRNDGAGCGHFEIGRRQGLTHDYHLRNLVEKQRPMKAGADVPNFKPGGT